MSARKLLLLVALALVLALAIPWLRGRGPELEPVGESIRDSFRIVGARTDTAASDAVHVLVQRVRSLKVSNVSLEVVGRERIDVHLPSAIPDRERQLLRRVLARAGHVEIAIEATDAVCAARGSTLEAERRRVEAWSAGHPSRALNEFDALPAGAGGPLTGLVWRAPWLTSANPIAVRDVAAREASAGADRALVLVPLEAASRVVPLAIDWAIESRDKAGNAGLELEVGDAAHAFVRRLLYERSGKDLVLIVDDEVCGRLRIENGQKSILFFQGEALSDPQLRRELLAVLGAGPLAVRLEPLAP